MSAGETLWAWCEGEPWKALSSRCAETGGGALSTGTCSQETPKHWSGLSPAGPTPSGETATAS